MAGIGVTLRRIFGRNTILTDFMGFGYSTMTTIAPMIFTIGVVILMQKALGFSELGYADRELFSCTITYMFIFAHIVTSPFNAVISRYLSDVIFDERYEDIIPCFNIGLLLNMLPACLLGIPFCLWEHIHGGVSVFYVFMGFCGYIGLVLTFYSMTFLSLCKDYRSITLYYLIGMIWTFALSLILRFLVGWDAPRSMLCALAGGFLLIAFLEMALIKRYFPNNSNRCRPFLKYFGKYGGLFIANLAYTLGLYIHNFVFWCSDMRITVADTFFCCQSYDLASFLAMMTNISASVIFTTRMEIGFGEKYKLYTESVIGGKWSDIERAKTRMFRQLASELMSLIRIQFIISVSLYLLFTIALPHLGFGGLVMKIYPCLAAGYFVIFLMNAAMILLCYFDDTRGAVLTAVSFCLATLAGSILAARLPEIWYGLGTVIGGFVGWIAAYSRLRWVEKNIYVHTFCRGHLMKKAAGTMPSGKVFDKNAPKIAEKQQNFHRNRKTKRNDEI